MDAIVKNRCEAEFLAVAYEIINLLELDVTLSAEALQEGGIRELWDFIVKETSYADKISTITCLALILQITLSQFPQTDADLVDLQKEDLKLSIEERSLNIKKLKVELSGGHLKEKTMESAKTIINKNPKIVTRRSNFYKILAHSKEVTQVGFSRLDNNQKPISKEIVVPKAAFINFIQRTNKLPIDVDDDARIEIVAPVLREGKAKWKGIYREEPISFFMDDKDYKEAVLAKRVSFKNGDIIACVLEIHRELNEVGDIVITKYSVQTVLDKMENGTPTETASGKKYRKRKKVEDSQAAFDFQKLP